MENYIAAALILLVLGGVTAYLIRAKKKGVKCVGCPNAAKCSGNCSSCHHK